MNKILISLLLLCTAFGPVRAQLIDPDDSPDLSWDVAQIGADNYTSLPKAFEAIKADNATIRLLIGVTLDVKTSLAVDYTTTLNLNDCPLVCALGTDLKIAADKVLTLQNGAVSGSFSLSGSGHLFAGADVKLAGTGVTAGTQAQSLYRILVKLATAEPVNSVRYGKTTVTRCRQQGDLLCCWLPQSVASMAITYASTPVGGGSPKRYTTAPLTVMGHAENAVTSEENEEVVTGNAAKVGDVEYATLKAAFDAVTSSGGTITLLDNVSLNEAVSPQKAVTVELDHWTLTTSGGAKIAPGAEGSVWMRNGYLDGSLEVSGIVIADQTVHLTAAVTYGGRQSYRTRLLLPADIAGKPVSFSYAGITDGKMKVMTESTQPVAYVWLPAHAASVFTLNINGTSLSKEGVIIQANHDNKVDIRQGDVEAVLYAAGEDPTVDPGTPFPTFHEALEAAGEADGSALWLQRDVALSGVTGHSHLIKENIQTELHLNGHTLQGTNCTLDASAPHACLRVCDADRGTGRITGTFRIKGNIYIGKDIVAGNIGMVWLNDADIETQVFRVLAQVDENGLSNGFATYRLGSDVAPCYVKDRLACIWLPVSVQPGTLTLDVGGNTYTATGVEVAASHANTVTVRKPAVVAKINETEYTSLATAFGAATDQDVIVLQQSVAASTELAVGSGRYVSFDLQEFTLSMQGGAVLKAEGSGSLLVRSDKERGIISGNFGITGNVCVDGSVSLSGLVTKEGKVVYRTCLYLPDDATAGTWTYDAQTGPLFLTGKKNVSGQAIAYIWPEVSQGTPDLKVNITAASASEKTLPNVLIQATHNNRFDMEAGTDVATVGGVYYPSFGSALAEANKGGGTILLTTSQTLNGMQNVTANVVIDLGGHTLSLAANAAFDVSKGSSLQITDQTAGSGKGYLYGTLLLNGSVYIDPEVRLSGTVIRNGEMAYRLTVDGLPTGGTWQKVRYAADGSDVDGTLLNGVACLWLPGERREEDLLFTFADGAVYETTLYPSLPSHNTRQKAYRQVVVSADTQWADDANKDCHVIVQPGKILTIATNGKLKTLHRVTMCTGSQLICDERVLATDGIVYRRSFTDANRWEAFSLPYEARRITAVVDGNPVELSPYLLSGTGGHFWLQALADDGTFRYVAEEILKANAGYIIAVPEGLTTKDNNTMAVSFISAGNQFLNRTPVIGVPPTEKGFRPFATGSLANIALTQPFYQLNAEGTKYMRTTASAAKPVYLPPFGSYVLTDVETLKSNATLRMAGLPTAIDIPRPVAGGLRVYGGRGCVRVEAEADTLLRVYTFGGQLRALQSIPAGETILRLPAGLYIVNGKKVSISE